MSEPGSSSTPTILAEWKSERAWKAQKPEPHMLLDEQNGDGKLFEYEITGMEKSAKYSVGLMFKTFPDEIYKRNCNNDRTENVFQKVEGGKVDQKAILIMNDEWKTGDEWMRDPVDFDVFEKWTIETNISEHKMDVGTGWKLQVGVVFNKKLNEDKENVVISSEDVHGQTFIVYRLEDRGEMRRLERDSESEQASSSQASSSQASSSQASSSQASSSQASSSQASSSQASSSQASSSQASTSQKIRVDTRQLLAKNYTDEDEPQQHLRAALKYLFTKYLIKPDKFSAIRVNWLSKDCWTSQDPVPHIVLDESLDKSMFKYKITGLKKSAKYSFGLVFEPHPEHIYLKDNRDKRLTFHESKVTSSKIKKVPPYFMHENGLTSGKHWMEKDFSFDHMKFREMWKSVLPVFVSHDEICLESGRKYTVRMKIKEEGAEEAVFDHIPELCFIACSKEGMLPKPDPSSPIQVEWLSRDRWEEQEPSHIVMLGQSDNGMFEYKITGLEESASYAVWLVFNPDPEYIYRKRAKGKVYQESTKEGKLIFDESKDTSSKMNKVSLRFPSLFKFQSGEQWMKRNVNFTYIVFSEMKKSETPAESQPNMIRLGTGWKYEVGIRIEKRDVEEAVYEHSVPGQFFIVYPMKTNQRRSDETRKSGGDGNHDDEGSPSKKRFAPNVQEEEEPVDEHVQ